MVQFNPEIKDTTSFPGFQKPNPFSPTKPEPIP